MADTEGVEESHATDKFTFLQQLIDNALARAEQIAAERAPAVNDETGHCVECGRDNRGHEGESCADDCPMYDESIDKIPFDDGENF